jgi:prepilin-type processing-associated H-X9-DG protein
MNETQNWAPANGNIAGQFARQGSVVAVVVKVLAMLGIGGFAAALMLPAVRTARPAAYRNACQNNLKQIALGLLMYVDKHGELPPAYTTDKDGKLLHSWRTLILPYIEEAALYEKIDLTKPWDDPVNAEACKTVVAVYQCPGAGLEDNRTTYLAVVTRDSCFRATEPRKLAELTDKQSRTLMLIEGESDRAVPWMAPLDADESVVMSVREKSHPGGMNAALVDGHVTFLAADTPADQRRALISIAGNDDEVAARAE